MNSPCVNCCADSKVCKECDWYNGIWISKDQYEQRLKADMVNMLEELNKEMNPIKECEHQIYGTGDHWNFVGKCQDVINSKINGIKRKSCAKENGCISCSLEDEDCCRKLFENSTEETLR